MASSLISRLSFRPCFVFDRHPSKRQALVDLYHIDALGHLPGRFQPDDLVVLAIKPQGLSEFVSAELLPCLGAQGPVVVSIAAGVSLHCLQTWLPSARVVRMMPNIVVTVGQGCLGWYFPEYITEQEKTDLYHMFVECGQSVCLSSEQHIDALTAISGCGPAYVLYWLEAWLDAARTLGFDQQTAYTLCEQTMRGSLAWWRREQCAPETLYRQVMSKGGVTEQAIRHFDTCSLQQHIQEGILQAYHRSQDLKQG